MHEHSKAIVVKVLYYGCYQTLSDAIREPGLQGLIYETSFSAITLIIGYHKMRVKIRHYIEKPGFPDALAFPSQSLR